MLLLHAAQPALDQVTPGSGKHADIMSDISNADGVSRLQKL